MTKKFSSDGFTCDAEVFSNENGMVVRFSDQKKEHGKEQISDLVIVDAGFGYICIKVKGEDALISGYLDETVFISDEMVHRAIEFCETLLIHSIAYAPYHVKKVKFSGYTEYNGEY